MAVTKKPAAKKAAAKKPATKSYDKKPVDWEALAKKLQRALAAEMKDTEALRYEIGVLQAIIHNLEASQSWFRRIFTFKF